MFGFLTCLARGAGKLPSGNSKCMLIVGLFHFPDHAANDSGDSKYVLTEMEDWCRETGTDYQSYINVLKSHLHRGNTVSCGNR